MESDDHERTIFRVFRVKKMTSDDHVTELRTFFPVVQLKK